jgi:hypothetical protein
MALARMEEIKKRFLLHEYHGSWVPGICFTALPMTERKIPFHPR